MISKRLKCSADRIDESKAGKTDPGPDIGNSLMSMGGKSEDWILGIADRRTADAAAVSQKVRKLSERRHGGGRLINNCSKHNFVRCRRKQRLRIMS